jgi:pimeloyl-ACP methyl ester carboxylesterase
MLGAGYRPPYTGFDFPVLYMRSALDRIASTQAFEDEVKRRPDCRFVELTEANHWFPEQHSDLVIAELRRFLS